MKNVRLTNGVETCPQTGMAIDHPASAHAADCDCRFFVKAHIEAHLSCGCGWKGKRTTFKSREPCPKCGRRPKVENRYAS